MSHLPIQLIVGLGNPGVKYQITRHNAGYGFVNALAKAYQATFKMETKFSGEVAKITLANQVVWLLKPTTFMNRSGLAVAALAHYYKIPVEHILVAHDELDFDAGIIKLKRAGGHAGHNGLRDIIKAFNSKDFLRLRIGIGHPGNHRDVVNYVLKPATKAQQQQIEEAHAKALNQIQNIVKGDLQLAMNQLH